MRSQLNPGMNISDNIELRVSKQEGNLYIIVKNKVSHGRTTWKIYTISNYEYIIKKGKTKGFNSLF